MKPLVLATRSKYKIELFSRLGLDFQTADPYFEERRRAGEAPVQQAVRLAEGKAKALAGDFKNHLIVGSDQVLALGGNILTKPGSTDAAVRQLTELAGRAHLLHTAFSLFDSATGHMTARTVTSRLTLHGDLCPRFLRTMVERDATQDCVGGYKFESMGVLLMKAVETPDPNAIIGLPLIAVVAELKKRGYLDACFQSNASKN